MSGYDPTSQPHHRRCLAGFRNQNNTQAGRRCPALMRDVVRFERLAHQNRERIPERGQHAKGLGICGTLIVIRDITKYTKAKMLPPGKTTEAFPALLDRCRQTSRRRVRRAGLALR